MWCSQGAGVWLQLLLGLWPAGAVGGLCTREGLDPPGPGTVGRGHVCCSKLERWIFEQILPSGDKLEPYVLPGSNSWVTPLSFCPSHECGEDTGPCWLIKTLLTTLLRPGASPPKMLYVFTIIKRRVCKSSF